MFEINENVIYVKGAKRGAIYNLNTGDVFSINEEGCVILNKLVCKEMIATKENDYLKLLNSNGLLDENFKVRNYIPNKHCSRLRLVWLEITQACNMRCLHCYEGNRHISGKSMLTLEEWKEVIDQIATLAVERVVVIGGEPCIHKHIKEILEYLSEKKISTTLFTNAYFLDDDLNQIIINNKIDVKVSLYGHTPALHDSITGIRGSFEKLIINVKYLISNGVNVSIAVTMMKENEQHYEDIKLFVKKLNVFSIKFDVIREVENGNQCSHLPEIKEIVQMSYRKRPNFYIKKNDFDEYFLHNTCWYSKLVISEDGNILPCVFARNVSCGNVKSNTIQEILVSNALKKCWDFDCSHIEVCQDCEYRFACKDCRPMALANNNWNAKNPRCRYNPYNGEWENE